MNFISQLMPRRFHSARNVWRWAAGNEDSDLWTLDGIYRFGEEEVPTVTSVFVPSDIQRRAIANGQNIALTVLGSQPPVMLRLTDEPIGKPPEPPSR